MYEPVYEEYLSPYKLNEEVVSVLSNLNFISYSGNEDEPADVIPYPEGLINSLRKRYAFRNEIAVRDFLEEHPFLIQLLFRAHKKIREYFSLASAPRLALEVVADPEAQEERELFVFIQTKLPPKAARPLLAEFDREWWLDAMLDAKGEMNISLQYARDER